MRRASNGVLPPDRFEPDDSVQAARAIPVGQHDDLTLHQPSDRDYYRVTLTTGTAMLTTTFADAIGKPYVNISKADDCAGGAVELSNVLTPNQRAAAYSVTAGQYVIQVSAGLALPYDLGITSSASSPGRDAFEGAGGNDSFAAASFLGTGRGVHATLIDSAGNVIAEGVRGERGDSERLSLQGTVAGEPYVIRLDRDIGVTPDRGLKLPRLRGQLRMVE